MSSDDDDSGSEQSAFFSAKQSRADLVYPEGDTAGGIRGTYKDGEEIGATPSGPHGELDADELASRLNADEEHPRGGSSDVQEANTQEASSRRQTKPLTGTQQDTSESRNCPSKIVVSRAPFILPYRVL